MIELSPQHKRGLTLRGPLHNAAGVLGFAGEYRGLLDFSRLGAFITNPITLHARTPAAPPNAVALPDGVLIHTGLPNPGLRVALRRFPREWERDLLRLGVPVIVHLAATTPGEVRRSVDWIEREERVSGVELGFRDDVTAGELELLVRAARGVPLIARLPAGRGLELAEAAVRAGADALTVSAPPRRTVGGVTGRYYGRDCLLAALEEVRAVCALLPETPVIGAGGVFTPDDARAMREAGAVAVQLDAVLWRDPGVLAALNAER
ncbi:MAG: hypothetical protein RMK99_14825 [Anaerolineales bacterium]|nr:hypothetical protein [Anaerolineales bacterium]